MKGMVLAAGYGTRFRPATYQTAKPMVPLCNRPLIAYAVDSLLAAGVRDVVVNLHHLPEQIESFLSASYGSRCHLHFSFEPQILGTGGGVRKVQSLLAEEESFYLVNGDTIQRPPLDDLRRILLETRSVAALLLRRPPADDQFTPVMFERGFVTGFDKGSGEALMFAGAHALSRRIFSAMPQGDVFGLTEDVYGPLIERGTDTITGVAYQDFWFDIGTPRRYLMASMEMLGLLAGGTIAVPRGSELEPGRALLVGEQSRVHGEPERSVIGARCRVQTQSRIQDSVLWDSIDTGAATVIHRSVLAHGVVLPDGARVENALLCRAIPGVEYDERSLVRRGDLVAAAIDPQRRIILELNGL
jgi:NDP-sugar pyrophosphorylase family protein